MELQGYEIKRGQYISVRAKGTVNGLYVLKTLNAWAKDTVLRELQNGLKNRAKTQADYS